MTSKEVTLGRVQFILATNVNSTVGHSKFQGDNFRHRFALQLF
jgi:hypothetical protein